MAKSTEAEVEFLRYRLDAETLCFGERQKEALFRPTSEVFRYSSLVGALKSVFGESDGNPIHAVGRFRHKPARQMLGYAPRDRGRLISTVPLEIEYLTNVQAEVFVLKNSFTQTWPREFSLSIGAMKSKGFGRCRLTREGEVQYSRSSIRKGELVVRVPDNEEVKSVFGIIMPSDGSAVYGYLFKPTSQTTGVYVRSLFEESVVMAYDLVLKPQQGGGR